MMRKFCKNLLSFFSFFILLIIFYEILTSYYINKKAEFSFEKKTKYLVFGHSHPETAFNDSLISDFYNLAQSGESYFYTYQKAKEIFKQNDSIETVFIEFTNNQINEEMDLWIWGDKYINNRYPIYSSFMSVDDNKLLLKNNFEGFYNVFSISSKNKFLRIIMNDFDFIEEVGGYNYLIRNKTDSLLNNIKEVDKSSFTVFSKINEPEISEFNLLYLSKLINLCDKNNIRVVLIRSPLHKKYSGYRNENVYQEILTTYFSDVEYLDLSKFFVPDEEFGDLEHLNYKGAQKFSIWFDNLIQNGLLKSPINQLKINESMDDFNK